MHVSSMQLQVGYMLTSLSSRLYVYYVTSRVKVSLIYTTEGLRQCKPSDVTDLYYGSHFLNYYVAIAS